MGYDAYCEGKALRRAEVLYAAAYHPDLQGLLGICELLWGEELLCAMYDKPELYEEFAVPCDRILLERYGGGIMHFCGRGDHYITRLCSQPLLTGVNMSLPHLNDMEIIYRNTVDRGIPPVGFPPDRAYADAARGFHGRMQIAP